MSGVDFTCESGVLSKALRDINSIVRGPQTIPIIGNVLIQASTEGVVTLTATNLDIVAIRHLTAAVDRAGASTVAIGRFSDVAASFEGGAQCRIQQKEDRGAIVASSGRARFTFQTLPATDFPKMPFEDALASVTMPCRDLAKPLDAVRHAISTEETRYYLCGVFVHTGGTDALRYAATDGYRVARCVMPLPDGGKSIPDTIIRTATVDLVRRLANDRTGDVQIDFAASKTRFDFGDLIVIAKDVEGTFPDYTRAVPTSAPHKALLDRDSVAAAAGRVVMAVDDRTRAIKLTFSREKLTMNTTGLDSQGAEEVPCDFEGADIEIGFNGRFLRDAIAALDADTIEFGLTDSGSITLISSPASKDLTLAVMPTRV